METEMVRVIRDPRNASLDYLLSLEEARAMLRQGLLFWDIANECYCTPRQRNCSAAPMTATSSELRDVNAGTTSTTYLVDQGLLPSGAGG
jgi:hypothetical protein